MRKTFTQAGLAILFLGTFCATASVASAQERVRVVGQPNTPCPNSQYITINDAVKAADPGKVIEICPGNWQRVTSSGGPPNSASTALLLTDGTVMVHQGCTPNWYKLTPDAFGNYLTGTWSQIASMQPTYGTLYYASAVLADGRVVVIGGEFNFCGDVITPQGAIYDPKADNWAVLDVPPFMPDPIGGIGDSQSAVLPNGKLLLAFSGLQIAQFDPATLTFTLVGNSVSKADINNEEGWTLLPDGTVLTIDTRNGTNSERYIPSAGHWIGAGSTIEPIAAGAEIGPAGFSADWPDILSLPARGSSIHSSAEKKNPPLANPVLHRFSILHRLGQP